VGKLEGKRPLGTPRRRWDDNTKKDLEEMGWDVKTMLKELFIINILHFTRAIIGWNLNIYELAFSKGPSTLLVLV
jgi:hypothetical protein